MCVYLKNEISKSPPSPHLCSQKEGGGGGGINSCIINVGALSTLGCIYYAVHVYSCAQCY